MHAIAEALPADAIVVDEAISSAGGLHRFLKTSDPLSYFGNRGGGIGWGLPAAVGVQLAVPERRVVALIGDGSAMYSIQALYTAARERIPVVFVIINNSSYRILKQRTNAMKSFAAQMDLLYRHGSRKPCRSGSSTWRAGLAWRRTGRRRSPMCAICCRLRWRAPPPR